MTRATVDATVRDVFAALESPAAGATPAGASPGGATIVAAVAARSTPDLASRLRAALGAQGTTVGRIGIAAAGLHHVATLELPASSRAALEAAAVTLGATVSIVGGDR